MARNLKRNPPGNRTGTVGVRDTSPRPAPAQAAPSQGRFPRAGLLAAVLLVGATVLAYEPIRDNGFVFDDEDYVTQNSHVQAGLNGSDVAWAFTTGFASNWHPLTWLSLQLDNQFFGMQPSAYHRTNLLLHVANVLLLLVVLRKMTGAFWRSAFVAGLFALHPLHVESVAWVAERKDVLSTLFGLLALLAYTGYVKRPKWSRYFLVVLAFILSLLAKPMLVTLPFVLLLLDYWPLGRGVLIREGEAPAEPLAKARQEPRPPESGHWPRGRFRQPAGTAAVQLSRLVWEKVPLLLLAAASCAITWYVQQQGNSVQVLAQMPLSARVGNALVSYAVYLRKMFWPADLAAYYPHPGTALPAVHVAAAALFLTAVTAGVLWLRRKAPYLAVGWFWYLGTLVPVIGLVQVGMQSMADRYTYVPLIGIFLMIAWGASDLAARGQFQAQTLWAGVAVLLLFGWSLLTWLQVHHWRNGVTLWAQALAVAPDNPVAHTNLGCAIMENLPSPEDEQLAFAHFQAAVALTPNQVGGNLGLALLYQKWGQTREAIQGFRKVLRLEPGNVTAQEALRYYQQPPRPRESPARPGPPSGSN
jgi:protein O-mannosyl-transferase